MAVPFLVEQLGGSATLAIEVAWGADLTAAATSWAWTDITDDVYFSGGVNMKHGRADEAGIAQPAQCRVTLDNSTGAYSLGGQSPNWPNVKQNTPLRVRVDPGDGSGYRVLFIGYADSWEPSWDMTANVSAVSLTASGILRRMEQNTAPILSALRRRLSTESNVVAYWPLEEGSNSRQGLSAFERHPPMNVTAGVVDFASDTSSFDSALQLPVLRNGSLAGSVPSYTSTGEQQVRTLLAFPDAGLTNLAVLLRITMASTTLSQVDIVYGTGGSLTLNGYMPAVGGGLTSVIAGGPYNVGVIDGTSKRLFVELAQNGTGIDWDFGVQSIEEPGGAKGSGTLAASTLGRITRVEVCPTANSDGLAVGHVVVQNEVTGLFADFHELTAFDGESANDRVARLCDENGIPCLRVTDGITGSADTLTDLMGPQRPASVLSLLRGAEAVNGGILFDGQSDLGGLTLRLRQTRENQTTRMTVAANELAAPLQPTYDDQGRVNKMEVTRQGGGSLTVEDVTGPLGTATVGVYDASKTLSLQKDEALLDHAGWEIHEGTVEGYRHPSLALNLAATPDLIPEWLLAAIPTRRISVTGVTTEVGQYPEDDVELEVQGFEQMLTPHRWDVRINCAPWEPWRVIRLADTTGDTDARNGRLDTDGSTLNASALVGATSLSVATTSGPLWTTVADDFPFDIEVGGIVVTVTAISGAASPQTFTVTGSTVTKALTAGLAVQVHRPAVLAL